MDIIYKRRSIRKYKEKPVDKKTLLNIVKAGMNAPSAGDEKPWQFIIITEREILTKITEIHPYSSMLHQAPAAILVCGDLSKERHEGFWVLDCSAATENMLLEITASNLGGIWLGIYPREERVKGLIMLFNLPEKIVPFSLVPVGYADEIKEAKNIFDETIIRYNTWK